MLKHVTQILSFCGSMMVAGLPLANASVSFTCNFSEGPLGSFFLMGSGKVVSNPDVTTLLFTEVRDSQVLSGVDLKAEIESLQFSHILEYQTSWEGNGMTFDKVRRNVYAVTLDLKTRGTEIGVLPAPNFGKTNSVSGLLGFCTELKVLKKKEPKFPTPMHAPAPAPASASASTTAL